MHTFFSFSKDQLVKDAVTLQRRTDRENYLYAQFLSVLTRAIDDGPSV